jgi:uncharacterized repeat protein (TIGR02543 family)
VPTDVLSPYWNGDTVTIHGKGSLEKSGYTFVEWNTQSDGNGTPYMQGDKFNITGDTILYARWKANTLGAPTEVANTRTTTSVTLTPIDGVEYKYDTDGLGGGTYQDSNVFSNLDPDTTYYFYQRTKVTSPDIIGDDSPFLIVKTNKVTPPANNRKWHDFQWGDDLVCDVPLTEQEGIYSFELTQGANPPPSLYVEADNIIVKWGKIAGSLYLQGDNAKTTSIDIGKDLVIDGANGEFYGGTVNGSAYLNGENTKATGWFTIKKNLYINSANIEVYQATIEGDVYINAPGASFKNTNVKGNIYVNAKNVSLTEGVVDGNIVIGPGVGDGDVNIKLYNTPKIIHDLGLTTNPQAGLIINGGGSNSVHVEDSIFSNILVDKKKTDKNEPVRLEIKGESTFIGPITVNSDAILENAQGSDTNLGEVTVTDVASSNSIVIIRGSWPTVTQQSANTISLEGTVENPALVNRLNIESSSTILTSDNATINILSIIKSASSVLLGGAGTIDKAEVSEKSNVNYSNLIKMPKEIIPILSSSEKVDENAIIKGSISTDLTSPEKTAVNDKKVAKKLVIPKSSLPKIKKTKTTTQKSSSSKVKKVATIKVGKKLTVTVKKIKGVKITYQWYAGTKKINKATKATFKPTKKQIGKKLSVKVTYKKVGYASVVKTLKVNKRVVK